MSFFKRILGGSSSPDPAPPVGRSAAPPSPLAGPSSSAYPVCGSLLLEQIPDPAHRAAHEGLTFKASWEKSRDEHIAALYTLTASGCPNAAKEWAELPEWWGKGGRGKYDGAMFVLARFTEMGVIDKELVRSVTSNLGVDVYAMKDGPSLLIRAADVHGAWLAPFTPCDGHAEIGQTCRCFDPSHDAARSISSKITAEHVAALAALLTEDQDVAATTSVKDWVKPIRRMRAAYPASWAVVASTVGQLAEKSGKLDLAHRLFADAIATGDAPDTAYDRLSLKAEREGDFGTAAALAESGAEVTVSQTMRVTLTKRAERCSAKAQP